MDVLQDKLIFSREDEAVVGGVKWQCKLLLINFKKLLSACNIAESNGEVNDEWSSICEHGLHDMLHAVAGVCSMSLPDMEIPAIYSTITSPGCNTLIAVASKQSIIAHRKSTGWHKSLQPPHKVTSPTSTENKAGEDEDVNPFARVISDGEESPAEEEEEGESIDVFVEERENFLNEAAKRRSFTEQLDEASVGAEHCVLGCAAFSRLPAPSEVKAVQLSLLAVRKSCRKMGIGRHLMQCCKDPEIVGHYNVLLVFSDPKADDFFIRHGFSEDPILTARYQPIVDHWENSTLMVYTPPFSGAGLAIGSLQTLTHFQDYYKQWRESAISGYSMQLGVMERLRHELLLLHSKVQAQDELIVALSHELKQIKEAKMFLEQEFQQYRKHSQRLMCKAATDVAQEWINTNN